MEYRAFKITVKGLLRNVFEVRDEDRLLYTVKSVDIFGKTIEMTDAYGNVRYTIIRPFAFWKLHFHILSGSQLISHVEGSYGWRPKLEFTGQLSGLSVVGKLSGHEYKMFNKSGDEVGIVSRKRWSAKDEYGIAVQQDENLELYILIPILIDKYKMQRSWMT